MNLAPNGNEVGYVGNQYLEKKYGHLKKKNAKFEDLPEIYVRVRKPRMRSGKILPSTNHFTKTKEGGVSVFTARYSPNTGFVFVDLNDALGYEEESGYSIENTYQGLENRNLDMYLVDGEVVNGEQRIIIGYDGKEIDVTPINNYIRGADGERLLGTENFKIIGKLNPDKIVADNDFYVNYKFEDKPNAFSGKKLKRYPKYKNGGEIPTHKFILYDDLNEALEDKLYKQATEYFEKKVTDDYWHFSKQYYNGNEITYEVYSVKGGFWLNFEVKNKKIIPSSAKLLPIKKYANGGNINFTYEIGGL